MMDAMPQIVLLSKLCPPGMEAVVYSLLAGFANFGEAVASSIGSLAIDQFGIRTPDDGTRCDFDNLSWLIFFCHLFTRADRAPHVCARAGRQNDGRLVCGCGGRERVRAGGCD